MIRTLICEDRIRTYDTYCSVVDILKAISSTNPYEELVRYKKKYPTTMFLTHKFEGVGQRDTPIIDIDDVDDFIKKIIVGKRISLDQKREWMKDVVGPTYVRSYVECEVFALIQKATKCYHSCVNFQ